VSLGEALQLLAILAAVWPVCLLAERIADGNDQSRK
jgi:hypothetical protein